jgi:transcriptional regulator with XRE-family HTH domain
MSIQDVVAAKVREARNGAGLTQSQLAEKLGTTWHTISRWERRVKLPTIEEIALLGEVTGRDPDWFLRATDTVGVTPRDALEVLRRHFYDDDTKGG